MRVFMPDIQAFAPNVWIVDGPRVRDMGVMFTTRMTIVKLSDGSLWVDSPVPVPFETLKGITELGPVRYLVAATPRHVWRLEGWHTLFPEAELWASRPTPFTLKKGHLLFSGTLGDTPIPPGPMTSTNSPSKAAPSSRKSCSCIERRARSSWMISSRSIRG